MPLEGGLNAEFEEVRPPLDCAGPNDLRELVLHDIRASPPATRVRAALVFGGVPLSRVRIVYEKPKGPYGKIPVLFVNGRQLNDSHSIVRALAPVLTGGTGLTHLEVDLDLFVCQKLMLAYEGAAFAGPKTIVQFMKMNQMKGFMYEWVVPLPGISDLVAYHYGSRFKARHPHLPTVEECTRELSQRLDDQAFFAGAEPGVVDAAVYGALAVFVEGGMQFAVDAVEDAGLRNWYDFMRKRVPPEEIFPAAER